MLGHSSARQEQLEAENRVLRGELQAANERAEMLLGMIATLRAERDTAAYQLTQLAAVAQVATQQAQAGRGFILGETALERQCWN